MKRVLNFFVFLIAILALNNIAMAQTGPGGVGNATGTNGQPRNVLWLDASDLSLTDGVNVTSWADSSGNANDLMQIDVNFQPEFYLNQLNGFPIVRFVAANNTRLVKADFGPSVASKAYSVIIVYKTSTATDNTDALVSYAISSQDNELLIYDNSDLTTYISGNINSSSLSFQNGGNFQIATHKWRSSDGTLRLFQNGTQQYSATFQAGDSITANGTLAIGGDQDALDAGYDVAEAFSGDIAEIIMFSSYINDAQRTIIENYLNIKYGIAISNKVFGNDADYNTSYNYDLTGVGQELDGNQLYATCDNTGFYLQSVGSLDNGDYIMVAHDGSTNTARTPNNVSGSVEARWEKDWYIEQTGEQNAKITFDFSEGITDGLSPQNISNYVLLYRATTIGNPDYSIVSASSLILTNGDQLAFTALGANLPTGYYTLGTLDQTNSPLEGASTKTWYTLTGGDWNSPAIWTLDPSGALPNNPTNTYPQFASEKVVIKSGKNVLMNLSGLEFASVTVEGTLDLAQTTGHHFHYIKGNGRIKMAADNFPTGDSTHFVTKGQGEGTAVYYGTSSYNLSTPRTFYNLEISMTSGQSVTLLDDYTINGYLQVKVGTLQINDGISTTALNIDVHGDLDVSTGAFIATGAANARHQLNLYGNFTNAGEVRFTNLVSASYSATPTTGIVDANFLHASKNQTINCNGLTNFYRIEIDKGVDKTYELYIVASDAANFNLFGRANYTHTDVAQLDDSQALLDDERNLNALGLYRGTVRIGSNVNIPVLNNTGNYNISEAAQLWVDGGTVTKSAGTAIVPYGTARVSAGTFTASVNSGFTFRDNGLIKVEGGTLNANQIRNSVFGASNVGGYYQSGGVANIGASSTNTDYYTFNFSYGNNSFTMSGGTLHISQPNAMGGVFINSDPGNYNVTGGTVIFDIDNTNDFVITSKAPFWDVIMRNSAVNANQHILDAAVNVGTDNVNLSAQKLTVLNDLTIEADAEFDANNTDLEIGDDFEFANGASYIPGTNTTRFIGNSGGYIYVRDNLNPAPLKFYNVEIEKDQRYNTSLFHAVSLGSTGRTTTSTDANNTAIQIDGNLKIIRGELNTYRYKISHKGNIEIIDGQILANATNPGRIVLNGSLLQTIKGSYVAEQEFGTIELSNAAGAKLLSNINVINFMLNQGIMDLDIYNLYVSGSLTTVGTYSNTLMFKTAGNPGDGGITIPWDLSVGTTGTTLLFPFGTGAQYTPALLTQSATVADVGEFTINPVNTYHPSVDPTKLTQTIPYYWIVDTANFSTLNYTQIKYTFTYPGSIPGSLNKGSNLWDGDWDWHEHNSVKNGNDIEFPYAAYLTTEFTLGNKSAFNKPQVYYSTTVSSGNNTDFNNGDHWDNTARWSTVGHYSTTNSGTYPQAGDIAIMGFGLSSSTATTDNAQRSHWFYVDADVSVGKLVFANEVINADGVAVTRTNSYLPQLIINDDSALDFVVGSVGGEGTFNVYVGCSTCNPDPAVTVPVIANINADFSDFANNPTSRFDYDLVTSNNTAVYLPTTFPDIYPNVHVKGQNGSNRALIFQKDILIKGDLTIRENAVLRLSDSQYGDIEIFGNLDFTINSGSDELQFPTSGYERTFTLGGDILMGDGTGDVITVLNTTPSGLIHTFKLGGNIEKLSGNTFDLFTDNAGGNNVVLELTGENSATYTSNDNPSDLYRIVLNKGGVGTPTFEFSDAFTLGGPTNGDEKAIELISGTLNLNDVAIIVDLSTGGADFKIPAGTSLLASNATLNVSGNNTGIWLDGYMRIGWASNWNINGGTNNYIEYTPSGSSEIAVYQGNLFVGSQIRRQENTDEGILNFRQEHSNSTVVIGTDASITNNGRGIFEIVNTGSKFKQVADAKIVIANASANNNTPSFYLNLDLVDNPVAADIDSTSIIQFGSTETQINQNLGIYSNVSLGDIVVDNSSGNNPVVTMETLPLTLTGDLNIDTDAEFDANGLDLTINSDFIINTNGIFTHNNNTCYFSGDTLQNIIGTTTFYNLTKNTADTLILGTNSEITIENELTLTDGIFDDNGNTVNVHGNVVNEITTLSSVSGNGIMMNGTAEQQITGSGTFSILTVNNVNSVVIPTGNTITIDQNLKLLNGVFDIGRNLLILNKNAAIEEAAPFSETNMIQTNISFTDAGVRKYFPAISSATQFIYPMGSEGKYTPVQLDITACDDNGAVRVKAANERHISIIEDVDDPEITDIDNVLQYHWTLDATGISNFSGMAIMESYADDVKITSPYTVADYITASLIDSTLGSWTKYSTDDFNEATNELYFYFANTDDLGIDGDYTAGIDDAIPDKVPSYITKQNGPWNDANTWETYPDNSGTVPAGGPRGAIVYVKDTVTMPQNFMAAYITNILSTGEVNVGSTFGHRLGIVNGTGKLYIERGDLPAGVYDGFFAADSGTIEYGYTGILNGDQKYDILSEITYVNNLILSGNGERRFPNLDVTIYGDWTITVDSVINEHNQMITVDGNIDFTPGYFDAGSGSSAIVRMGGNSTQTITGDFIGTNAFYNFQMNNSGGVILSASDIEIDNNLNLLSGVLSSSATNTVTLHNLATTSGGSNSSFVNGPLFKSITGGNSFDFPVGNNGRYGKFHLNPVTTGYWQVQYYNVNPSSAGYNTSLFTAPLTMVSNNEYWRVQSPGGTGGTASVGLRWDGQSGMPTADSRVSQLKIVEWRDPDNSPADGDTSDDLWVNVLGTYSISNAVSSGTISSTASFTFDEFSGKGNIFTLSSEATVSSPNWEGDVSTDWNTAGNWSTNSVPTSIDAVTINAASPNHPTISSNAVCGTMNLASGYTLTIAPKGSLTLSGTLTMDGNITILSDATGTGSLIDNGIVADLASVATVQRYVSGNLVYHYIGSPLSAVNNTLLYTVPGETKDNPNFYQYNETLNYVDFTYCWERPVKGNTLAVGQGYAYAFSRNYTFNLTGGVFNTGPLTFDVTHTANNGAAIDGWNLISNPYPSAISAEDFLSVNSAKIDGTVYFWDDDESAGDSYDSNDYATWNLAGAIGSSSSSGSKVPDGFISNGQAFFVHVPIGSGTHTETLDFTNSMRRIGNGQFFKNTAQDDAMRLRLSITNDTERLYNEALLVFLEGATDGYDNFYDGKKNKGNTNIAFYSILNGEDYAIQSFEPLNIRKHPVKEVSMGYSVKLAGTYSFNLVGIENIGADINVYLLDKQTGEFTNLKEIQNYAFTTNAGTYNDRFVIRFNKIGEYANTAPSLRRLINDYSATEDQNFSAELDKNTFGDVDVNDKLTYTAKLVGGGSLPTWLTFNPETFTLSGLPANGDVGTLSVEITATDNSDATADDIFTIEVVNVNDAPQVVNQVPNQQVIEGQLYSYTAPLSTFIDVDLGDNIVITASIEGGGSLPAWLIYNDATHKFEGQPQNADIGIYNIQLSATDNSGATVSDIFSVEVLNINDAPQLVNQVPDQKINEDATFAYSAPLDMFTDIDVNDALTVTASTPGGGSIPTWLVFNSETYTFEGQPENKDVGDYFIQISATDNSGATASDVFKIEVINVNDAPTLNNAIQDQSVNEKSTLTYTVPSNTFSDVDLGDQLTISASLSDGSNWPTWLTFNPVTSAFSGTPVNDNVGTYSIKILATDNSGATATDIFTIEVVNVNDAPIVNSAIQDQTVNEKSTFAYTLPSTTFMDIDLDDQLTISAGMSDGSNWPDWLTFDPVTSAFSGTPVNDNVGTYSIKILATDNSGATATDIFTIEVVNVNDAPEIVSEIPDQEVDQNSLYEYTIPVNTFNDIDLNDELTITVKMADGSELPTWLSFDQVTGKLAGTAEIAGDLLLSVVATDIAGASVSDQFILSVKSTTGVGEPEGDKIMIYPNPTKGQLLIETKIVVSNTRFIVRDYYGKTITVKLAEGKSTIIDLSSYADGIYFIEMKTGNNSKLYKIVLQK